MMGLITDSQYLQFIMIRGDGFGLPLTSLHHMMHSVGHVHTVLIPIYLADE